MRKHRIRAAATFASVLAFSCVYSQSYLGRVRIHDQQIDGCHRAVDQRLDDLERDSDLLDATRDEALRARIWARMDRTTTRVVECNVVYPKPSALPWKG
jgi:hypothetical protein